MSIEVKEYKRQSIERSFLDEIDTSYQELCAILPTMPDVLNVRFDDRDNYGETGVDGFSISKDTIGICIRPDDADRNAQHRKIQPLVFHEGYHMRQGFHYDAGIFSAVEAAIYEGCATVFERDYAASVPKWGNYAAEGDEKLRTWYDSMKNISAEQYFEPSGETWKKWAFYDSETKESWRVYKVGTWLIDRLIKESGVSIIDLCTKNADDINHLIGKYGIVS